MSFYSVVKSFWSQLGILSLFQPTKTSRTFYKDAMGNVGMYLNEITLWMKPTDRRRQY